MNRRLPKALTHKRVHLPREFNSASDDDRLLAAWSGYSDAQLAAAVDEAPTPGDRQIRRRVILLRLQRQGDRR